MDKITHDSFITIKEQITIMKKLILFMLAIAPAVTFAQENYVIKGKVGAVSAPSKIFLTYRADGKTISDSNLVDRLPILPGQRWFWIIREWVL